jgi:hypothetical protein
MNYPPTTRSSRHLMTSKLRSLCDGTESVRLSCRFWRLSYPFPALFGALKPYHEAIDTPFRPSLDPSRRNNYRLTTTLQLLTKKRSIFLSMVFPYPSPLKVILIPITSFTYGRRGMLLGIYIATSLTRPLSQHITHIRK